MIDTRSEFSQTTLNVLGVACLSLAAASGPLSLSPTAAGVGLILVSWSYLAGDGKADPNSFRWAGVALILIIVIRFSGLVGAIPGRDFAIHPVWVGLLLMSALIGIVWGHRRRPRLLSLSVGLFAVLVATAAMTVVEWRSEVGIDVYRMHRGAGEALLTGANPYTDAVSVLDGSPFADEGAVIEGYPYPPVVLGTYGLAAAVGDPRLVSSLCWIGVISWLGWRARTVDRRSNAAYAMFLLLSGLAVWPQVWFASWTEPLSVALLLLAAVWWNHRPTSSAVALGLAIASKQYFVFLAPLLLLHKDQWKKQRLVVSLSVAATTILVGLLPNPSAFVRATIGNLADIGFRPDTQSLPRLLRSWGIDFYLPPSVWIAASLAVAVLVARRSVSVGDFIGRAGLILGLVFFIGQAFPNYWFLVLSLIAIGTVLRDGSEGAQSMDDEADEAPESRTVTSASGEY